MHKKNILGFILGLLLAGGTWAADIPLKPNHPESYVVVKGDTLWDIAGKFLRNPWQWPDIWHANPQIKNPHLIYPGDRLSLIYVDGKPRLVLDRGRRTVRLSPKGRVQPLDRAVPTIPLDAVMPFLTKPRIVGKDELDKAPYIIHSQGERIIAATGHKVYVRGLPADSGRDFTVARSGDTFIDPNTKEVLGYEALYVGDAKLERPGDPATMVLVSTNREVLNGDRLLSSAGKEFDSHFQPHPPQREVDGQILSVLDGVNQIGRHQVVVINRGQRDGIEVGHVLGVYQKGETIVDRFARDGKESVKLPDERAGSLMVFRTFEKLSYALIMEAERNMHVLDYVRNP